MRTRRCRARRHRRCACRRRCHAGIAASRASTFRTNWLDQDVRGLGDDAGAAELRHRPGRAARRHRCRPACRPGRLGEAIVEHELRAAAAALVDALALDVAGVRSRRPASTCASPSNEALNGPSFMQTRPGIARRRPCVGQLGAGHAAGDSRARPGTAPRRLARGRATVKDWLIFIGSAPRRGGCACAALSPDATAMPALVRIAPALRIAAPFPPP